MDKHFQHPLMPGLTLLHKSSTCVLATPSLLKDEEAQLQTIMKQRMECELSSATFYVNLISEGGTLHSNPNVMDRVMGDLHGTFSTLVSNSKSFSTPTNLSSLKRAPGKKAYHSCL